MWSARSYVYDQMEGRERRGWGSMWAGKGEVALVLVWCPALCSSADRFGCVWGRGEGVCERGEGFKESYGVMKTCSHKVIFVLGGGGIPRNFWWGFAARFTKALNLFSNLALKIHTHFKTLSRFCKIHAHFRPYWQKSLKSILIFRPKRLYNYTLWGRT